MYSTASIVKEYDIFGSQQNRHAINFVYQDREGNMWALTGGGLFRYDEKADSFVTYPPLGKNNAPYTMCQDQSGNYWIGTWGEGLWQVLSKERRGKNVIKTSYYQFQKWGNGTDLFIV